MDEAQKRIADIRKRIVALRAQLERVDQVSETQSRVLGATPNPVEEKRNAELDAIRQKLRKGG